MTNSSNDTISAIATVIGTGGVSIIRLSGENSLKIVQKIFFKKNKQSFSSIKKNSITHGYIFDNDNLIDEVVVLYFQTPNSYTGEDVVEIQCHGGIQVTETILNLTLKSGARLAERGEFTKRAFMNGKLDLSQAEAVLDIISAKTKKFAQKSASNLCGKLAEKINSIRDDVIELLSEIVAAIDFPEEVEEPAYDKIDKKIAILVKDIDNILKGSGASNLLRNGTKIAIAGKPNVGKSSLFNSLLNFDRAIVTDIAGTTRDIIQENLDINGIPITLIDTAGIRNIENSSDSNKVENIGIEFSKRSIDEAQGVIFVTDLSIKPTKEDDEIYELIKDKHHIIVGTKADLPQQNEIFKTDVIVSNIDKTGLSELIKKISDLIVYNTSDENDFLTNARQQEALINAKNSLLTAKEGIKNRIEQDFVAIDIKSALMFLGEITGDDINQEILNNIFEKFCIGK